MESKYTKGPWRFTEMKDPIHISIHQEGYGPKEMNDGDSGLHSICGIWGDLSERSIADANLISSAPLMINQLEHLLKWMKAKGYAQEGHAIYDETLDVILKATSI